MKKFSEYLKDRNMFDDVDDIIAAVSDYLEDKADETEREESYATNRINRMREAAAEVRNIEYDEYND